MAKPQQVNGAGGSSESAPIPSPATQSIAELKAQVGALVQREEQSQALLERHSLVLDAVLENMQILLGDRFVDVKGKSATAPLTTAPDVDVDELDELTPLGTPQPSRAPSPINASAFAATSSSVPANGHGHPTFIPNMSGQKSRLSNGQYANNTPSSSQAAPTFNDASSSRDLIRAAVSASRTTTDNDDEGIEEELDDDARSMPGISALPAALSPASTASADDPEGGGGYVADASHRQTPAPVAAGPSKISPRFGDEPRTYAMLLARDSSDMQIGRRGRYPASDVDDLEDNDDYLEDDGR